MVEDDLVAAYAAEAKAAMSAEAAKRIAETVDPIEEERLRSTSLLTLSTPKIWFQPCYRDWVK